jgi:hypothetical protein
MISDVALPETVGVPAEHWHAAAQANSPAFLPANADDLLARTEELHRTWHGRNGRISVFLAQLPSGAPPVCSSVAPNSRKSWMSECTPTCSRLVLRP